jgi:hypothetical protein
MQYATSSGNYFDDINLDNTLGLDFYGDSVDTIERGWRWFVVAWRAARQLPRQYHLASARPRSRSKAADREGEGGI